MSEKITAKTFEEGKAKAEALAKAWHDWSEEEGWDNPNWDFFIDALDDLLDFFDVAPPL